MFPSLRLLHACRITLFTRPNCSLCTNAKQALAVAWEMHPFDYYEIDIMKPENKKWRDLYEFDSPVIHICHSTEEMESPGASSIKLMHRFNAKDILTRMNLLLKKSS